MLYSKDIKVNISQVDVIRCTGCGLCAEVCPCSCILLDLDNEGFVTPVIDSDRCINCGRCLSSCPTTKSVDDLYYRAQRNYFCSSIANKEMLINSSSGGLFGVLAEYILEQNGYVCGCVYNDNVEAVHIVTNSKNDVQKMYGSKYVQSRLGDCYKEILALLKSGKTVLFTGTACQIAALRIYVGLESSNLYCVEILCHGVPSPGLFKLFKEYLSQKYRGEIIDIKFRDKHKKGWGSEHRMSVTYKINGQIKQKFPVMPAYFSAFFYGLNLRESCYNCKFARLERVADLTIGDFWGAWDKFHSEFKQGISVVGVNSGKGQNLIDSVYARFDFFEKLTESEAIKSNGNFEHPVARPIERNHFYKNLQIYGYRGLWRRVYFTKTYRLKTLKTIYGAFVPAKLRFLLHKL